MHFFSICLSCRVGARPIILVLGFDGLYVMWILALKKGYIKKEDICLIFAHLTSIASSQFDIWTGVDIWGENILNLLRVIMQGNQLLKKMKRM